jgi:hypothetical protein
MSSRPTDEAALRRTGSCLEAMRSSVKDLWPCPLRGSLGNLEVRNRCERCLPVSDHFVHE